MLLLTFCTDTILVLFTLSCFFELFAALLSSLALADILLYEP